METLSQAVANAAVWRKAEKGYTWPRKSTEISLIRWLYNRNTAAVSLIPLFRCFIWLYTLTFKHLIELLRCKHTTLSFLRENTVLFSHTQTSLHQMHITQMLRLWPLNFCDSCWSLIQDELSLYWNRDETSIQMPVTWDVNEPVFCCWPDIWHHRWRQRKHLSDRYHKNVTVSLFSWWSCQQY